MAVPQLQPLHQHTQTTGLSPLLTDGEMAPIGAQVVWGGKTEKRLTRPLLQPYPQLRRIPGP